MALVVTDPGINSLLVATTITDPAFRDLGIQVLTDLDEADGDVLEVIGAKQAPSFVGQLTGDAVFEINLGGGKQMVTVLQTDTVSNRTILDLVVDVQKAVDRPVLSPAFPIGE